MSKTDQLNEMLVNNGGYLFTKDVEQAGISRTYLAEFVKVNELEKVAKGIYISSDTWEDSLYILQLRYPKVVFSGETALYLHDMIDREYSEIMVSVPPKFNRTRLCDEGIKVRQEKTEEYELGIVSLETNYGHSVRVYDREKCICEMVKHRGELEVQHFQTAMKTYMRSKDKDLSRLMRYAEALCISDEIRKYTEVML